MLLRRIDLCIPTIEGKVLLSIKQQTHVVFSLWAATLPVATAMAKSGDRSTGIRAAGVMSHLPRRTYSSSNTLLCSDALFKISINYPVFFLWHCRIGFCLIHNPSQATRDVIAFKNRIFTVRRFQNYGVTHWRLQYFTKNTIITNQYSDIK